MTRILLGLLLAAATLCAQASGPANGALLIAGGGVQDAAIWDRFIALAGGPDAPVVIIPTAGGAADYPADWDRLESFRRAGLRNLTVLHTYDRAEADRDDFVEPLRSARGVWFGGGRQWRLADSYLDTKVHQALLKLLARGGVIGGSSAGATIQGEYLARGDTRNNTIMMGDHERGLAFVKGVAIDQHLLRRNRQFDLLEVIGARPDLLGIGIDEDTAIVVQGDVFEVIGRSYVAIYDAADRAHQGRDFRLLSAGRRFDLNKRVELAPEQPSQISKQADEYLRRVSADGAFSGAALVAHGGEVLLSRGYGFADREWKIPVKSDTKFRLGSITKQFTAAAILQLQERGLLQVDDLVSKHLPDYPQGGRITIHHLLTHTSGTPTYTVPGARPDMVLPMSREQLLDRFQDQPLEFEPGSDWRYSNSGYYLLGVIVETASGAPYEQYLQRNIFEPLEMSDTGYDRSEDVLPKRAAGYRRTKHGIENAGYADMSWPYAAGALYSTIEDLYRWDRALAEGGILSDKSREQAFANQFTKQGVGSYGYGWAVGERLGQRYVEHGGGINGFSTMIARYIDDDAVIIVLSNIENANAHRHADELAKILFGRR